MRRPPVIFALAALVLVGAPATGLAAGSQEIVFTSDRAENLFGEIYAARVDGAGFRDITRNPAADTNAALSPDGTRLAFWSNRNGKSSVYLSHADGTGLRRVRGDLDTGGQTPGPLSWSPDGTLLLAAVPRSHGGGAVRNEVDVIDARRATARRLLPDGCFTPEWSQDGQLVACSQAGEVVVLDLQGHRRFRSAGGEPMWSSNGMLAVSDGGTVVYDAQGQQLARFPGQPRAWSPDGSLLAVERAGSLMVVGSDGSNAVTVVRRLVSGSSRLVPDFVSFTPDGQSIAYDATGAGPKLVAVTGGPSVTLPGSGAWSADSARYAFVLQRRGGVQIRVGNRFGASLASARPATGRLRGRASPLVAERPQHHLRHEPPQQRPRALRDPVGRQRAARADRRLDRRARPGVVARREHAGVHLGPLRRPRVQGLRPHAAHRPRRRDLLAGAHTPRVGYLRQRRGVVAGRLEDRLRSRDERYARAAVHREPRRLRTSHPSHRACARRHRPGRRTARCWRSSPLRRARAASSRPTWPAAPSTPRCRRRRASAPPTCTIPSGRPTAP